MPRTPIRGHFIIALGLGITAAALLSPGPAGAQAGAAAWKGGKVFVPAALSKSGVACDSAPDGKCVADIKDGKHPVIVFLHGCGGPRSPATFLNLGAIVVAPNSFAGGARCKPDGAYMAQLVKTRHGDVTFAVKQVTAAPWADPGKLLLAGYSNGAQTTATYPGSEFKARIIVAWTCTNPRVPEQNGIRGTGPALALLGTADEFYKKVGIGGNCDSAMAGRAGSKSVSIPGGSHEILDHATTRKEVAAFVPGLLR